MASESVERLLGRIDRPLAPSPEFAAALREQLLAELSSDSVRPGGRGDDAVAPVFPRAGISPPMSTAPAAPWGGRFVAQLATAALVLLALAAVLVAIRAGQPEQQEQFVPAIASPPATPDVVIDDAMPVTLVWETTGGPDRPIDAIAGLGVDPDGNLWVADGLNDRFQIFSPDGTFRETWGVSGSGEGQLNLKRPFGAIFSGYGDVAFDAEGNIYIADAGNFRVQKFGPDRRFLLAWGEEGTGDGQFQTPLYLAVGVNGDVFVRDLGRRDVQRFDADGHFLNTIGEPESTDGLCHEPGGLAIDGNGNVAVADCNNSKIRTYTPAGDLLDEWGTYGWAEGQLGFPRDLAIDAGGRLWIVDEGRNSIQVFDKEHHFLTEFGRTGAKPASGFSAVWSIALDDRGQVYVIDTLENRVSAFHIEPPLSP
jgi:DNA-binding beta-propeller fold protein YncE